MMAVDRLNEGAVGSGLLVHRGHLRLEDVDQMRLPQLDGRFWFYFFQRLLIVLLHLNFHILVLFDEVRDRVAHYLVLVWRKNRGGGLFCTSAALD